VSLRAKILLSIGATFVGLFLALLLAMRVVVVDGFEAYEGQETRRDVQRVLAALDDDLAGLRATTRDWAAWDDTYAFMRDPRFDYLRANLLADTTPINHRLNLILYLDAAGRLVFSRAYDFAARRPLAVPPDLLAHLAPERLGALREPGEGTAGLLALRDGLMLVSAEPILTSDRRGPARGTVIFGRRLDPPALRRLAALTLAAPIAHRPGDPGLPPEVAAALAAPAARRPIAVQALSSERMAGFALLDDLYGRPALVVEVQRPREVYARARRILLYVMLALSFATLVLCGLVLAWLRGGLLSRVQALGATVRQIGQSGDATARVAVRGSDEVSRLGDAINGMLEARARSQAERDRAQAAQQDLARQVRDVQSKQTVGRLAEGLAQDFANLLTIVTGRLASLQSRLGGDALSHDVELIRQTAERAAALVQHLLAFSQRQVTRPRPLDLNEVLRTMDERLRGLCGERIALRAVLAPDPGRVHADPWQVEQVVLNLVSNARDAMPEGGELTLETAAVVLDAPFVSAHPGARPGPHVLLRVADSGTGMDDATLARIFEPFFTTKRVGQGTGLGLATVYAIVKQHGGYVAVESAPGQGSRFTVYFPALPRDAPGGAGLPPALRAPTSVLVASEAPGPPPE
jgi:signal transduction histidine kinase